MKTIKEFFNVANLNKKLNCFFDFDGVMKPFKKEWLNKTFEIELSQKVEQLDMFGNKHSYRIPTGETKVIETNTEYFKYSWAHVCNKVEPYEETLMTMKQLNEAGNDCYIITCYSTTAEIKDKKDFISKYLPWFNQNKIIFVPEGKDKSDYTCGNRGILFDDWSRNCEQWEKKPGNIAVLIKVGE